MKIKPCTILDLVFFFFFFAELHIFWKMVMSLPEGNEMLSDWLKAKFKKGTVPNAHPGSKVRLKLPSGMGISHHPFAHTIGGSKKISLRDLSVTFHFKVSLHVTFLARLHYSFYCRQNNGPNPIDILSVIHTATIGTMLNITRIHSSRMPTARSLTVYCSIRWPPSWMQTSPGCRPPSWM